MEILWEIFFCLPSYLGIRKRKRGVRRSLEIEKGKGDKDNHIYRNPMPYEKITQPCWFPNTGWAFSSLTFKVALVFKA
jgi:hypothetical protein